MLTAHGETTTEPADLTSPPPRTSEWAKLKTRRAVCRVADQHGCRGRRCRHPDHRRDVHFAVTLADMLDLPLK